MDLLCSGPVDRLDIQKYYKPTPTQTLYLSQVSNVLGCMPLMSLFLHAWLSKLCKPSMGGLLLILRIGKSLCYRMGPRVSLATPR